MNALLLLVLLLAASKRSSGGGGGAPRARGGPWWPGEDNLGTMPIPPDRHPSPPAPPLK